MKLPQKIPFDLIKLSEISDKNKNWILGGIMLFIFFLDYFLIMQPLQLSPLIKLGPKIREGKENYKEAVTDVHMIDNYKKQVAELQSTMQEVGMRISSKEEIPNILDNISRLAIASNIQINQIMPLKDSQTLVLKNEEGRYYAIAILLDAKGAYHDIGRFLSRIENDKIFMSVTNFDIESNSSDPMKHAIRMTIKAFILERNNPEKKK